jgi:hypothetical protein
MSIGLYKFVLSHAGILYVGFSHGDYHEDIAGIPRQEVKAAGYLHWGVEEKWFPNGKSIGYDIDVSGCEDEVISLLPTTEDALHEEMYVQQDDEQQPRAKFWSKK